MGDHQHPGGGPDATEGGRAQPRVWVTYRPSSDPARDLADLLRHGVGSVSCEATTPDEARRALAMARAHGMRLHISLPDMTERADLVRAAGLVPEDALMLGGAFRGRAMDRHLFAFEPRMHTLVIEPPVYNAGFAYRERNSDPDAPGLLQPIAHYFPDMPAPVKAEVVVPLKEFDGRQHLRIVPAAIAPAGPHDRPEGDTVTPDMPPADETRDRRLYRLTFDLTGLDGALLDRVGLAVYWPYHGTDRYWFFGRGNVSAWAPSTRDALRRAVRDLLDLWTRAAGGVFPSETVHAMRFGDECFFATSHLALSLGMASPAVSYPLWDFSAPSVAAFRAEAGGLEWPRTWGHPEIYGSDACAAWLHTLHRGCAQLCALVREEAHRAAPGLVVFRNTTRMGVFDLCNEHDGSGQELLAANLDAVHLDPYPVRGTGYEPEIPRDMSYCAGLARRYRRPLIPWMQAHTYGGKRGLQHVNAEDVRRMAREQWAQGVDAVVWLGYGQRCTFPSTDPAAWEEAAQFHRRLIDNPPPKPPVRLAVLRDYAARAALSLEGEELRNPADWLLQQFLEVWAVEEGRAYDVFELAPGHDAAALDRAIEPYPLVVGTRIHPRAWVLDEGTRGRTVNPADAACIRADLRSQMVARGWLPAGA